MKYLNENGKIQLLCENDNSVAGYFSMQIVLRNTENIRSSTIVNRVVTPGSIIETFVPTDPYKSYNLGSYSYRYLRGRYTAKPNLEQVYRLPYSTSIRVQVSSLNYIGSKYGDEKTPEHWRPFHFKLEKGDTVYAARRGKVVSVLEDEDFLQTDGHVSYNSAKNFVIIEHSDGTLAKYSVVEKGSVMVKLGDAVTLATPIALAGTLDGNRWQLRFEITQTSINEQRDETKPFESIYLNPILRQPMEISN